MTLYLFLFLLLYFLILSLVLRSLNVVTKRIGH
jgi:hypothetical protein